MLKIRRSTERGLGDHGWLKSRHTFSFANYYDPKHMGFRSLRVINEDRITGGTGFGAHPHRDMEIISYVVSGELEHEDSMGNKAVIRPGEVQRMSAGSGVVHSEKNSNLAQDAHFFQIWVMPNKNGVAPGYGQKSFEPELQSKKLVLVVSEDGRDGSIPIKQDANLYISRLKDSDTVEWDLRKGRGAWVQLIKGQLEVNGQLLETGDGLSTEDAQQLKFVSRGASEFVILDLA